MEYGEETMIRGHFAELTRHLISKNLTISAMESCTSGQLISLLTDTEGASAVVRGGIVTYSNAIKETFGVPKTVIDTYSVYSEETASAMAAACAEKFGTDIAVGITGTFGNIDPENSESSIPGKVYYAIAFCGTNETFQLNLKEESSRLAYKLKTAEAVATTLQEILSDKE